MSGLKRNVFIYIIMGFGICLLCEFSAGKSHGKIKSGDELVVSDALKGGKEQPVSQQKGGAEPEETDSPNPSATDFHSTSKKPKETAMPSDSPQETTIPLNDDGYPQILSHEKVKIYSDTGTAVIGDAGFEIYNYVPSIAASYAKAINRAHKLFGGKVKVYDVLIPTSMGITLPDNKTDKVQSSSQKDSIKKITRQIKSPVKTISLYDKLMQHRNEYIYFRTDHHWTAKGAYYGYQKVCEETGHTPHKLSEYKKKRFGGFIGTYYSDTNGNKNLRKDLVAAYYPLGDAISMTYHNDAGRKTKGHVIVDSSKFGISAKYLAFMGGDNSYSVITNKEIKDDSVCVVVKESFGNALVPYMADHYSKIYVVDYRYWSGSLSKLVKENKVQEVFFMNNISMTRNSYLVGKLSQMIK